MTETGKRLVEELDEQGVEDVYLNLASERGHEILTTSRMLMSRWPTTR